MIGVGALIWSAVRPLLRLFILGGSGFVITRLDFFPLIAARGAGQIMLNILYPALLFSKIVPAFSSENLPALGPLVLVALIYQALGIFFAWVIRYLFWVPHRFRHGFLVAGGWGNTGDIPTAVIMAVTASAPFESSKDPGLSVAYISAFLLVGMITLFPCGGHNWISMDFKGPNVENDEMRLAAKKRRKALLTFFVGLVRRVRKDPGAKVGDQEQQQQINSEKEHATGSQGVPVAQSHDEHDQGSSSSSVSGSQLRNRERESASYFTERPQPSRHVSFLFEADEAATVVTAAGGAGEPSRLCSPAPTDSRTVSAVAEKEKEKDAIQASQAPANPTVLPTDPLALPTPSTKPPPTTSQRVLHHIRAFLSGLLIPLSIAIISSFIISLVPALKGLFVPINGENYYPTPPDGEPPLAFIMDAATFAGAGAIPLGLICLGSALARLKVPWSRAGMSELPVASIGWLAMARMVFTPVLGVVICQGLTTAGVIDENDKVLRFVCIFYSCLPTATTQVMLTQVYSGTGEAEHLPAYLIPQYVIMFLSLTTLTAYTLHIIF